MLDLQKHYIWSDGELCPAELTQRAIARGYKGMAITDHGDYSNMSDIIPNVADFCAKLEGNYPMPVLPGIEITHMPPETLKDCVEKARWLGAVIIVVHGETITEPVP